MQSVVNAYVGKDVPVSICDTDRKINRFVGNMVKAAQSRAFNSLRVLALFACTRALGMIPYPLFKHGLHSYCIKPPHNSML